MPTCYTTAKDVYLSLNSLDDQEIGITVYYLVHLLAVDWTQRKTDLSTA